MTSPPAWPQRESISTATLPHAGVAGRAVGAWTGHWIGFDHGFGGSAEVLIVTAGADAITAHFTFIDGGKVQTARRPGVVSADTLSFELVGGGEIQLHVAGDTLIGEFTDPRGGLPASHGLLQLTRAR
jgi:hypothetical protein